MLLGELPAVAYSTRVGSLRLTSSTAVLVSAPKLDVRRRETSLLNANGSSRNTAKQRQLMRKEEQRRMMRLWTQGDGEFATLDKSISVCLAPLLRRGYITIKGYLPHVPFSFSLVMPIQVILRIFVEPALFHHANRISKAEQEAERTGSDRNSWKNGKRVISALLGSSFNVIHCFTFLLQTLSIKPTDSAFGDRMVHIDAAYLDEEDAAVQDKIQGEQMIEQAMKATKEFDEEHGVDNINAMRVSSLQLNALYLAAERENALLPEAEQPTGLKNCTLHPFQKQALQWMKDREAGSVRRQREAAATGIISKQRHPLWDEYRIGKNGQVFYLNPFSGSLSTEFPEATGSARGGILADEMGMGKTVEALSLILANRPLPTFRSTFIASQASSRGCGGLVPQPATLVVAPLSLLGQWQAEIQRFSLLHVFLFYGDKSSRSRNFDGYDVVITSYGILTSDAKQGGALFRHHWHRIVLDEAHIIRNRFTLQSRAAFAISAENRWCLTGTPIQNQLDDIFALMHFLREAPWSDLGWWKNVIQQPYERGEKQALLRLKAVLGPLMLRRTKQMRNKDGHAIVSLPPCQQDVEHVTLSRAERRFYDMLFERSREVLNMFVAKGVQLKKYTAILTLIIRLRQACNHPFLVLPKILRKEQEGGGTAERTVENFARRFVDAFGPSDSLLSGDRSILTLDNKIVEQLVLPLAAGQATHLDSIEGISECDECEGAVKCAAHSGEGKPTAKKSAAGQKDGGAGPAPSSRSANAAMVAFSKFWMESSKTQAFMTSLGRVREDTSYVDVRGRKVFEKVVVFSQWTSMLDLVEVTLKKHKFRFLRLDGSVSLKQRNNVLEGFKSDPYVSVLLLSLHAGGVGLNLTAANHVYFLDCWWNPSVEDQALQRVHRIGQVRPVYVKRFIIEDSIEGRILQLQARKRNLASSVGLTENAPVESRMNDLVALFSTDVMANDSRAAQKRLAQVSGSAQSLSQLSKSMRREKPAQISHPARAATAPVDRDEGRTELSNSARVQTGNKQQLRKRQKLGISDDSGLPRWMTAADKSIFAEDCVVDLTDETTGVAKMKSSELRASVRVERKCDQSSDDCIDLCSSNGGCEGGDNGMEDNKKMASSIPGAKLPHVEVTVACAMDVNEVTPDNITKRTRRESHQPAVGDGGDKHRSRRPILQVVDDRGDVLVKGEIGHHDEGPRLKEGMKIAYGGTTTKTSQDGKDTWCVMGLNKTLQFGSDVTDAIDVTVSRLGKDLDELRASINRDRAKRILDGTWTTEDENKHFEEESSLLERRLELLRKRD